MGWIMNEVVDRFVNRSLFLSLEAARNVRAEADVVLYLVNARERPEDAGYVGPELTLLDALEKPVLMILNQVPGERLGNVKTLADRWMKHYSEHACLKEVLLLDAFLRSWHQELRLLDALEPLLAAPKQVALKRLRAHYTDEQQRHFEACARFAAETIWFAAHQTTENDDKDAKRVFARLLGELQKRLDQYLDVLISHHGLEAKGRAHLKADIEQMTGLVGKRLSEERTGLMAGAVTSAGSGLMADILAGGMTFGGGMLLGFLGGYLGGVSFARLRNMFGGKGPASWEKDALVQFYTLLASYYLLAALHGRGKGELVLGETTPFLIDAMAAVAPRLASRIDHLIDRARGDASAATAWTSSFVSVFRDHVAAVLAELSLDSGSVSKRENR
jgi:hypothetical protein